MYKKDETKDTKDKKMEQFMRCALYSAGFSSSDLNKANSVLGAGYTDIYGQNLTNKNNTASPLGPTNTEDQITYQNCLPIANNISERKYYESLGSDLGELETFTDAMGKEIFEILGSGEKIDTLKVK